MTHQATLRAFITEYSYNSWDERIASVEIMPQDEAKAITAMVEALTGIASIKCSCGWNGGCGCGDRAIAWVEEAAETIYHQLVAKLTGEIQ